MPEPRRDWLAEAIHIAVGKSETTPEKQHLLALLNLFDPVGLSCHFGCKNLDQYLDFCEKHELTPSRLGSRTGRD